MGARIEDARKRVDENVKVNSLLKKLKQEEFERELMEEEKLHAIAMEKEAKLIENKRLEAEEFKAMQLREQEQKAKEEESDEDWDALLDDDDISNRIMEERMAHLRSQANEAQDWKNKGHGVLNEITEED